MKVTKLKEESRKLNLLVTGLRKELIEGLIIKGKNDENINTDIAFHPKKH